MSARKPPSLPPMAGPSQLIPEKYLDIPSQRLYALSLGLLCQAVKLADFSWHILSGDDGLAKCRKWLFVDFVYCTTLAQLRIPRLNYSKAVVLLQIIVLWFFDGLMFGGISLNLPSTSHAFGPTPPSFSDGQAVPSTPQAISFLDYLTPLTFGLLSSATSKDDHLLGQHTVRMSPISTAHLNPQSLSYCLSPTNTFVLVPVLLNNTKISGLRYSITPLVDDIHGQAKAEIVDLTPKDLKAIEQLRVVRLRISQPTSSTHNPNEYDEYDDDDAPDQQNLQSSLQSTQSLVHIKLSKPGILRLESVSDASDTSTRIVYPSSLTVSPCPSVEFIDEESHNENTRCAGEDSDLKLMIRVRGVPPMSLRWLKTINGNREHFLVEGIQNDLDRDMTVAQNHQPIGTVRRAPQELKIPLSVSLDAPGTYVYALEEVVDGIGNVVRVGSDLVTSSGSASQTTTTRSLMVLRRAAFSFKNCRPGSATSLLIGSEVPLTISATESDEFDFPWEISLGYQPPTDADVSGKGSKRYKPWKKTLKTQGSRKEVTVRASAPGDYTILGVRGKWCSGDVLAPETCKVVEKPLPTAEIQWKRIHECSGDTGVSASLTLHGTPPFQVYYRMRRDKESPRELAKTFATSRGELTLQPDRSGHYTFTFVQISDTHYKRVELNGPSIEQVIHPPAGADFVTATSNHSGNKRKISSCEGNTVSLDVDLKGTGPWNLEVQVVGPRSSDIIEIQGIETPRESLQIPIPKGLDSDGGTFDINIVSVEDAYKCKRPVSVPGITVVVRGVKPTAKLYGSGHKRRVTVLENKSVALPLRLTGDAPWRLKYRRIEDGKVLTATLTSPNDNLVVDKKGVYELVDVADAYCPGFIISDASTYEVDWVPRPSARLSPKTKATYDPNNGSYILWSICEGTSSYVELDLQGHPPFQIMYNIAQNAEAGGTKLIDQPVFNSIQQHTRFQLQTSQPGRIYYEVKQIGDAEYPLAKHRNLIIPRAERLLFEQHVSARPSAHFKNRNRMSYCLNDAFVPLDALTADGTVLLDGTPPFTLVVSIKTVGTSQLDTRTIEIADHMWKINLPPYHFKSVGPHLVTIESVRDASKCAPAALDPLSSSIWVDVAETAAIIPFDKRVDYCVGDVMQFQLEGIPPWTIGYRLNGKSYSRETNVSPFSIQQQQPGEFVITSIAHQQKMCKAAVADLHFNVYSLPSAKVGHGKRIFQDIHEGDQAEIVFTLIGEPPFTFTYQRSEPSVKKGGKPGKVLETHTVSRINTHEYSVFSALEGTWTVTSISDRYCRYPAPQPDVVVDKQRQ